MKNNIIKNLLIVLIISVFAFTLTIAVYNHIPSEIVFVHSFTKPKDYFVWLLPSCTAIIGIILSFLPLLYNHMSKGELKIQDNSFRNVLAVICSVILGMQLLCICYWLDYVVTIYNVGIVAFGFLVSLIGNFMPRFKKHSLFAIYTPWTLANPLVWLRSHRVGGYIWTFGGVLILFMVLVPQPLNLWLVIIIFILCLASPAFYSLCYYQYLKKQGRISND